MKGTVLERFEAKLIPEPNSGCWLWIRAEETYKYGCFGYEGRTQRAHRVSYQLYKGNIPVGLHVRHTCDTPLCVNPDHLLLGTAQDNANDKMLRGRHRNGRRERTHCPKGHQYTPDNILTRPNRPGTRDCKECNRERMRK